MSGEHRELYALSTPRAIPPTSWSVATEAEGEERKDGAGREGAEHRERQAGSSPEPTPTARAVGQFALGRRPTGSSQGWLEPPRSEALEAQDALRGRPPEGKLTRGPANRKAASQPPFLFVRTPGRPEASYRFTPLPPPAPTGSGAMALATAGRGAAPPPFVSTTAAAGGAGATTASGASGPRRMPAFLSTAASILRYTSGFSRRKKRA